MKLTIERLVQYLNAEFPIIIRLLGSVMSSSDEQCSNICDCIIFMLAGRWTWCRFLSPLKVELCIYWTLSSKYIEDIADRLSALNTLLFIYGHFTDISVEVSEYVMLSDTSSVLSAAYFYSVYRSSDICEAISLFIISII